MRLGVKKVGCSGFAYTFDYADEVRAGDHPFEAFGAKVVVDDEALTLAGSTLDFVREGFKQVFKVNTPSCDVRLRRELQRRKRRDDHPVDTVDTPPHRRRGEMHHPVDTVDTPPHRRRGEMHHAVDTVDTPPHRRRGKVLPSFIRRGGTEGDGVVDIFLDDFDLEVT